MTDARGFWRRKRRGRLNVMELPEEYQSDWFAKSFDSDYARIYRNTDDTANKEVRGVVRYLDLPSRREDARDISILDLGCGWGRHSIPLAKRGFLVTGLDLSDTMLHRARADAEDENLAVSYFDMSDEQSVDMTPFHGPGIRFVRADMRRLAVNAQFDIVLNLFTSFGYFLDPDDNKQVLHAALNALKPGGRLLLDVNNADQYVSRGVGSSTLTITDELSNPHEVQRDEKFDYERNRRVVQYRFVDKDRVPIYLECELYSREELAELLLEQGFAVSENAWGNFDGMRYDKIAPRLIMMGTRPMTEGQAKD